MTPLARVISATEDNFFDSLEKNEKLFGTYTLDDGRVCLGFRKVKSAMYDSEKGIGILLDPDDIRHLINVLRFARKHARGIQYANDNACQQS